MNRFPLLLVLSICSFSLLATPPVLSCKELKNHPPRVTRTCCAFGSKMKLVVIPFVKLNHVIEFENLGAHHYLGHRDEGNGILYSEKGGFIDLGHVREWADWTAFLYLHILEVANSPSSKKKLGVEGGMRFLELQNIETLDAENRIKLAGKIAFDMSLWHEIATGYGVSVAPFITEKFSSFSAEDIYSNMLGIELSMKALQSPLDFETAMTNLLNEKLLALGVVGKLEETYAAFEQVESLWWSNDYGIPRNKVTLKRNYFETECIVPWLLPNQEAMIIPDELEVPASNIEGFSLSNCYVLTIRPNRKIPVHKVLPKHNGRKISQKQFEYFTDDVKIHLNKNDVKQPRKLKQV